MIKVDLQRISDFDLPLDTMESVVKRGESKRILKRLEKEYNLKSYYVCAKISDIYELYANVTYYYVPKYEKESWIENYEIFIRSSIVYKYWILFYKLCKFVGYDI